MKIEQQLRETIRMQGKSDKTADAYWGWVYLFTAENESRCPLTGKLFRHHQDMGHIARQIKNAATRCGFAKRVTSHCLRHSFATHSIENGVPIHVVQKLMGHTDIKTTETYLHVTKDGATAAQSPLTALLASPDSIQSPEHPQQIAKQNAAPKLKLFVG